MAMITTFDNPYNPFTNFTEWLSFDKEKGYNTCEYLARLANFTDDMSDKERDVAEEHAIDKIIRYDFANIYRKIPSKSSFTTET